MPNTIRLSVRSLVEYVCSSGSIESGFRTTSSMTEGTKVHQAIQKQYGEQDQKEVYVSVEIVIDDLLFIVDGRCDGLLAHETILTVDEIKSTARELAAITESSYPVHWAQAKMYAYIIAKDQGLDQMKVQLTYVQVVTGEQKRFVEVMPFVELEQFMLSMLAAYSPYAQLITHHARLRDESIKQLAFPFDQYREGQRKLAGAVYKTIADSGKLFAKAPTGIGKTISTIFPSIKAMGEGLLQRILYLTAKTITRTAAEEAYALLESKGLHLHTVTLTAKEKVCFKEEVRCSKEHCEYADGYYDRINEALLDLLSQETLMTRTVIEAYAHKHRVCPFEFALDAAYAADAMICDYNYVFDPRVSLKRLFDDQKRQTALLIDESHNLVDRAREMYSSELHKADFLAVQREYKTTNPALYQAAKAVNDSYIALRKQIGDRYTQVVKEPPESLVVLLETFVSLAEKELLVPGSGPGQGNALLLDLFYAAQSFIRIAKLYDERFVTYTECTKSDVRMKLFCLDPSHLLRQMSKGYRSVIFFSATLSPLNYYMDMLGGGSESDFSVTIPSPFSSTQLDVFIGPLSTRYQDRERTKDPIVRLISEMTKERPGNYLLFFPSYEYMNDAYERYAAAAEDGQANTIIQGTSMTEEDRENFLAAFAVEPISAMARLGPNDDGKKKAFVGFAVMGGIFSEGIDLVGDRLTGVVVVGVGLPQIGLERNIIREYFDSVGKNGFDYAFLYPGMNKVLQAGGRLIRSETDTGSLLLIDDRYLQPQYNRLLPQEWKNYTILNGPKPSSFS
ncbi:ATP-dependent helicase [Paenibacillus baekrokdamisoli]|uniref:ATP-dependent helicase n=1 Tax=Paenibacillus baekrokdamisoli TaxID=1712516 RepID=A0A3G9JKZ5_9BACL|nr:ATP-dependent DNA helicase [Paenibacillus baekrokdamisoli]MBB3068882.1 Rad3-related DNA helicase [Paenibacillus baekrokdamisoli]BBH23709.1 ATP-dependent helicase [Paenibacillus baekrokdamisoli]